MKLTKERCLKAVSRLRSLYKGIKNDYPLVERKKGEKMFSLNLDSDYGILHLVNEDKDVLEQLIEEHFDLIERIAPIQCKCAVDNETEYHYPNLIDDYVKQEIAHKMVEFLLKENVVQFEKEQDYARFQTVHKGEIYIVKPKGADNETN